MDWQEDYGSTSSEDTPFIQTNLGIDSWLFLEKILTIDSHNRREFRPATYFLALNRSENAVFLVRCTERPAVLDGETLARGGGHTCDITPLVKFPAPSQHSSFRNISFCTPFRRITLQHQFEPLRIALLWRDYRHVSSARNVLFIHALDPPLWYSYRLTHRATSSTPPPTRWESEFWENLLDLSPQRLYSGGDTAPFAPLPGLDPILTLPGKRISSFPSTMGGMHLHLTNLDTGLADDSPSLPSAGIRLHRFPDSPRLPHVKCLLWGPSPSTPIPPDTPPPALTLTTIFLSNHILPSPIEHHVQSHMPFTPHATRDDFCGCALHDYAYRVVLPRVRSRWASSLSSALNPRSWFRAASRASILPSTKAEAEEGVSYRDLPAREQALRRRDEAARELVADPERWGFVAVEEV
ncbi:MAG: hypothetical protein M1833_006894 [Piccolia ochrophora]|nr:MAG: hypothetical protein M1833_006894 [Piccolia ochrophora]